MPPTSPEIALENLLTELFESDELRRFLRGLPGGEDLYGALPGGTVARATLMYEAARLLKRRGELEGDFFPVLAKKVPRKRARIAEVAALWNIELPPNGEDHDPAPLERMKILFLASNPTDLGRLALDKEIRGIDERLQLSALRDRFELVSAWAVRPQDLSQQLLNHKPGIVHFSGHGSKDGIYLMGDSDQALRVPTAALASLFRLFANDVRCVVLNACYSKTQAAAIARHIPAVVGMDGLVDDRAGLLFAGGLYQGFGYGRTLAEAVDLGRNAYELRGITVTAPPRIKTRKGVDPSTFVLVPPL